MSNEAQHKAACLARWQALEQEAREKWQQYRRKRLSRRQLDDWLKQQDEMDGRTIRGMYNRMRG